LIWNPDQEVIVELRQLRYFVAVAEELHFRRAAVSLHVSQPPLSQQIRALETEMGCVLLKRTRRSVELTPSGETFLRDARGLLAGLDGAVATARRVAAGQSGRLRVAFVGSALLSLVPAIVHGFRTARPGVAIELRERPTVEGLRAVLDGTVDVGLVRAPIEEADELRCVRVLRERTVAALPTNHPLAALRRVPLGRLAAEPLVLFPREQAPGFHDLLMRSLAATGAHPEVVQYAPETLTIIGLVAAGIGVSLGAESMAHLSLDGVTYRTVTGAPHAELLAVSRADDDSPLVAAFVAHARDVGAA
jgi:DNA-binding transcriptional LysR family regulator